MRSKKTINIVTVLLLAIVLVFAGSCKKREVTEKPAAFDPHIDGVAVAPLPQLEVQAPARNPSSAPAFEEKEQESVPASSSTAEPVAEEVPTPSPSSTSTFDPNS
jgi:hypothetical protein